jgi:hypothetical protein
LEFKKKTGKKHICHGMIAFHIMGYFWIIDITYNILLVGGIPTPLKNMSSSVGMMTFPKYGKS